MKKRVLLLLPLFLGACSDSGESPVITIERLYVNTDPDLSLIHISEPTRP